MEHKRWVTSVVQRAILLVTLVSSASAACKQGSDWIEYQGNCYSMYGGYTNWFVSELNCKYMGAGLAVIRSQSENEFLLRLAQCSTNFWIGMVNINPTCRNSPHCYRWWDVTYPYFTALNASSASYHDCVHSDSTGRWHNTYCQNYFNGVCKAPAVQGSSDEQHQLTAAVLDSNEFAEIPDAAAADTSNATDAFYNGTLTPITTPAPSKCPSGWHQLDSSCYFHSLNKTNYFNAQLSCQAMGASVTSVLTRREHTLLTVLLGCNLPTWIGLEKARPCFKQPGRDHCWVWMDGSAVTNFYWALNQQLDRRDAECVILDGQWKVTNCYNEFGYLCKRSL